MKGTTKAAMIAISILAVIASAASCEPEGSSRFSGNYSFKTSGNISAVRDSSCMYDSTFNNMTRTIVDTTFQVDTVEIDGQKYAKIDTVISTHQESYVDTVLTQQLDTLVITLTNEAGQMDITETGKDDDVVVTMNVTGGEMLIYYADASGKDLILDPAKRHVSYTVSESNDTNNSLIINDNTVSVNDNVYTGDITVEGKGTRYDNIVIFDLTYSGVLKHDKLIYNIVGSSINCRAKVNE